MLYKQDFGPHDNQKQLKHAVSIQPQEAGGSHLKNLYAAGGAVHQMLQGLLGALVLVSLLLQHTLKVCHVVVLKVPDLCSGQSGSILNRIASCLHRSSMSVEQQVISAATTDPCQTHSTSILERVAGSVQGHMQTPIPCQSSAVLLLWDLHMVLHNLPPCTQDSHG